MNFFERKAGVKYSSIHIQKIVEDSVYIIFSKYIFPWFTA